MLIHWYGHAAFRIETGGTRIILDPFRSPDSGGYASIDEPADLVVVSHENDRYHSHLGQIVPPFQVIRALEIPPGGTEFRGIRFEAIPVFESPEKLSGDEVAIVHFRAEGVHLVFLGDLGHALEAKELQPIRGADVVLIPAGGSPTIDLALVSPLVEAIGPRVVIPMHYLTPRINLNILPVERFLEALPGWPVEATGSSELTIKVATSRDRRRIVRLEPSR